MLPVHGAPSPLWLEALDNAVILYLSLTSRLMSTDARILPAPIRTLAWRGSKKLIQIEVLAIGSERWHAVGIG